MSDPTVRLRRLWLGRHSAVWLEYLDCFGRWIPLLDEDGRPVNFDHRPRQRAAAAMKTADRLFGRE